MGDRIRRLLLGSALGLGTISCGDSVPSLEAEPAQRVDAVARLPPRPSPPAGPPSRGYVAVVYAGESVDIAPNTTGTLRTVDVRAGDRVEEGDRIATLDDTRAREELVMASAQLRSAQSRLEQAEAAAKKASRSSARSASLAKSGHIPSAEVEDASAERIRTQAAVREARAEVSGLRAALAQRQRQLDETVLTAAFSGTVAERYVHGGTVVSAGSRVVRLLGTGSPWVRFAVPPSHVDRLQVGDVVLAEFEGASNPVRATIEQIAPEVDPSSHLVLVEAQLALPDGEHQGRHPGAAAWVRLQ